MLVEGLHRLEAGKALGEKSILSVFCRRAETLKSGASRPASRIITKWVLKLLDLSLRRSRQPPRVALVVEVLGP